MVARHDRLAGRKCSLHHSIESDIGLMIVKKIVIFGVGLIGGSFALALKRAGVAGQIVGVDRSEAPLLRAKALGIIDVLSTSVADAVQGADLIMLAAPVAQTGSILAGIAPHVKRGTWAGGGGGTRGGGGAAGGEALGGKPARSVRGHPMGGREKR